MAVDEMRGERSGRKRAPAAHSQRPTPHLTSPLKGGRDELGKGGEGRWGGERGSAPVPACAGMTVGGRVPACAGMTEKSRNDGILNSP